MKILSIDVGIKNLAFCLFDKSPTSEHFKVTKWDIIDLSEQEINVRVNLNSEWNDIENVIQMSMFFY